MDGIKYHKFTMANGFSHPNKKKERVLMKHLIRAYYLGYEIPYSKSLMYLTRQLKKLTDVKGHDSGLSTKYVLQQFKYGKCDDEQLNTLKSRMFDVDLTLIEKYVIDDIERYINDSKNLIIKDFLEKALIRYICEFERGEVVVKELELLGRIQTLNKTKYVMDFPFDALAIDKFLHELSYTKERDVCK